MMNQEKQARVAAAERLYATFLRARLEPQHDGQFVAIEPDSGEYYPSHCDPSPMVRIKNFQ